MQSFSVIICNDSNSFYKIMKTTRVRKESIVQINVAICWQSAIFLLCIMQLRYVSKRTRDFIIL